MATEPDDDETTEADKKLEARISAAVNGATKKLRTMIEKQEAEIAKLRAAPAAPPAPGDAFTVPPAAAGEPVEVAKSLKEASTRIAELERQYKAEKTAKEAAETKAKKDRERGALTEIARKRGLSEPLTKAFVALHHGEGSGLSSDDKEVFFERDGERIPVSKWADDYFKGDEGKGFLPAKQVGGTGMGRGATNGAGAAGGDVEPSRAELGAALLQRWSPGGGG